MDQEAPIAPNGPPAAEASQDSSDLSSNRQKADRLYQSQDGWFGVLIASGLYPWLIALYLLINGMQSSPYPWGRSLLELIAGVAPFVLIGGVLMFPYLFVMALCISTVFALVDKVCETLRLEPNIATFAAFTGGLIGFLAAFLTFTLSIEPVGISSIDFSVLMVDLFIGPGLTTLMGQIGGAWGTMGHYREEPPRSRFQFNLRQMLILTAWVSVLLTLLRLTGLLTWLPMLILAIWVVYQAATLWVVLRLVKPLAAWWGGGK